MCTRLFSKLKMAFFLSSITVLSNVVLLITQSHLSVVLL